MAHNEDISVTYLDVSGAFLPKGVKARVVINLKAGSLPFCWWQLVVEC